MKFCGKTVNVKETVLYTISSLLSTVLDYAVYLTVLYLLHGEDYTYAVAPFGRHLFDLTSVNIAYSAARIISAIENFYANNYLVFGQRGKPGLFGRFVKYMILAIVVAILGNFCIAPLHNVLGIHPIVAKVITDVTVFVISFFGQKLFVF
ncbi:MAG: GtrA family protein [Clostridia bacterium]|nr:GtrA family protein [Clostridia bacterium]